MQDINENNEDIARWWIRRLTRVQVPTWLEKGLEHGRVVNNSIDFIDWGGVQHSVRHSRVWRCEDIDGCGGVTVRGWEDCMIYGKERDGKMSIAICRYDKNGWRVDWSLYL